MGRRGPLPKPTEIKKAAGNPGRRRLNEKEPIPPAGDVTAPTWLSEKAREVWNVAAPIAITMRTLTVADVLPFGRYCEAFARYLELKEFLMAKGPSGTTYPIRDQAGNVRTICELPQAIEYRRLHEILIRLEAHFGLTAAARARLTVERDLPPPPADGQPQRADQLRDFFAAGGPAKSRVV